MANERIIQAFDQYNTTRPKRKRVQAYNPDVEFTSLRRDHPWFNLDLRDIGITLADISTRIVNLLKDEDDGDDELKFIRQTWHDVKVVKLHAPVTVVISGEQGEGKSLLVNMLFHRRNLSKAAADGHGCTSCAVHYTHKPGSKDSEDTYRVKIQFRDDEDIKKTILDQIGKYYIYHCVTPEDQDEGLSESGEEQKNDAEAAERFLCWLCNAKNDIDEDVVLQGLLTATSIADNELFYHCMEKARQHIKQLGADAENTKHFYSLSADELMPVIEKFTLHRDDVQPIWPIVDHVDISLGSALGRNNITLIDTPGLGDSSQIRTAVTYEERRKADYEIIIGKPSRITHDINIENQLKQSIKEHGAKGTILVLTKIDDFLNDRHGIDEIIETEQAEPFPLIRVLKKGAEKRRDQLQDERDDDEGDEDDGEDEEYRSIRDLDKYIEYLRGRAGSLYIEQRAERTKREMIEKCLNHDEEPIHVFSVSSTHYREWMGRSAPANQLTLSPSESGIPALRQFLLTLTADRNYADYNNHISNVLPSFLEQMRRAVEENRRYVGYPDISQTVLDIVKSAKETSKKDFKRSLASKVVTSWRPQVSLQKIDQIIQGWTKGVACNTFNMLLADKGIARKSRANHLKNKSINWNQELMEEMLPDYGQYKIALDEAIIVFCEMLQGRMKTMCESAQNTIREVPTGLHMADKAGKDWMKCENKILSASSSLQEKMLAGVSKTYNYITSETDTGCMIASLNAGVYFGTLTSAQGKGRYALQRDALRQGLIKPDENRLTFIDRVRDKVTSMMKAKVETVFNEFIAELDNEIQAFKEGLGRFRQTDSGISARSRNVRTELKRMLPELEKMIAKLKRQLKDAQGPEVVTIKDEDGQPLKRIKRENGERQDESTIRVTSASS
ncbi:hypothetical protein K469DRAFT_750669 [Zopfia rhizophila CBS 207.26]|uniref:Dynamin N-terminal domain-containing protein n=1 Tax=Zopfia rhizophila CBS 207.26 TaxID=1314779 RepID=A0A6A6DYP8_9PEZI|nr:hypothetical protein K469DRAFT_750669 [Zopfia rhizophila CBS 207.26]